METTLTREHQELHGKLRRSGALSALFLIPKNYEVFNRQVEYSIGFLECQLAQITESDAYGYLDRAAALETTAAKYRELVTVQIEVLAPILEEEEQTSSTYYAALHRMEDGEVTGKVRFSRGMGAAWEYLNDLYRAGGQLSIGDTHCYHLYETSKYGDRWVPGFVGVYLVHRRAGKLEINYYEDMLE